MILARPLLLVVLCAISFSSGRFAKRETPIWELGREEYAEEKCDLPSVENEPMTELMMEDAIRNIGLQSIIDKLRPVSDNFLEQETPTLEGLYHDIVCVLQKLDDRGLEMLGEGIVDICDGGEDYTTPTGMATCLISICVEITTCINTMKGYEDTPENAANVADTFTRLSFALIRLQKAIGILHDQLDAKRALSTAKNRDVVRAHYTKEMPSVLGYPKNRDVVRAHYTKEMPSVLGYAKNGDVVRAHYTKRELGGRAGPSGSTLSQEIEECPGASDIEAELKDDTPVDPALRKTILADSDLETTVKDLKDKVQAYLDGTQDPAEAGTVTYLKTARSTIICDLAPFYKVVYHMMEGGNPLCFDKDLDITDPDQINTCLVKAFDWLDEGWNVLKAESGPPVDDLAVAAQRVWNTLSNFATGFVNIIKMRKARRELFHLMRELENLGRTGA